MVDILISSLCLQMTQVPEAKQYYTACLNASNAASIQYKIKPTLDDLEQKLNKIVIKKTGERVWWLLGVAYSYEQKGNLNLHVNAKPFIDDVGLQGAPDGSGRMDLTWYW